MKILVVCSCFAPKNVIGAVRISKIVKYLIRAGHEVTVISPVLEDYDGRDETLECEEFRKVKRITVPYSSLTAKLTRIHKSEANRSSASEIGNRTNVSYRAKLYRRLRNIFASWRDYEWSHKVNAIIRADSTVYDVVFSSYPNVSTHNSALYAKKTGKAKKWIADFRDPIALDSVHGKAKRKIDKVQSEIVRRADLVTHVSKASCEHFVCYPEDKNKIVWVSNGFDEEDFNNIPAAKNTSSPDTLIFSYAGGLYGGERDCSPIFKAIKELLDENHLTSGQVRFDYAGRDFGILKKQADRFGVAEVINDRGLLPRAESIEMQMSSDCVAVATFCYTDNGGAMTGKIYEPIMMRRPILMTVSGPGKNSEPGKFVKILNAGTVYEESSDHGDVQEIKKMILSMVKEKKMTGKVSSRIDEDKRNEYSYSSITNKLSGLISNM